MSDSGNCAHYLDEGDDQHLHQYSESNQQKHVLMPSNGIFSRKHLDIHEVTREKSQYPMEIRMDGHHHTNPFLESDPINPSFDDYLSSLSLELFYKSDFDAISFFSKYPVRKYI